jgi:hypothetical protein
VGTGVATARAERAVPKRLTAHRHLAESLSFGLLRA